MASSFYQPEAWHDFFVMAGGAAGALTGLLFVAMSLHLSQVTGSREHRNRSEGTLASLVVMIVVAALGLIPGQPAVLLGVELVAAFAALLVFYAVRARRNWPGGSLPRGVAIRTALGAGLTLTGIASGVLLMIGLGWGLFLVVLVFIGGVVMGVANTWSILLASEEADLSADR